MQRQPLANSPERDILMQFVVDDGTLPNGLNWKSARQAKLPLLAPSPFAPVVQDVTLPLADSGHWKHGGMDQRTGGYAIFNDVTHVTTYNGNRETATHGHVFTSIEATTQAGCFYRTTVETGLATIGDPGKGC